MNEFHTLIKSVEKVPRGVAAEEYGKADCVCVCQCIPAVTAQRLQCDKN